MPWDYWKKNFRVLTAADVQEDPAWMFAPVGVLSNAERHAINASQAKRFAAQHGVPVLRWRRQMFKYGADKKKGYEKRLRASNLLPTVVKDQMYDSDPGMWSYFVPGAPMMCLENVNSDRKVANGTTCIARSLSFSTAEEQQHVEDLVRFADPGDVIDLAEAPLSVNVEVKLSTAAEAAAWPADAMFPRAAAGQDANAVVIPILKSSMYDGSRSR